MPRFFFDFRNSETDLDDQGQELPDAETAKKEALAALGDAVRDHTYRNKDGRITIRVRDHGRHIMDVSATIEIKMM